MWKFLISAILWITLSYALNRAWNVGGTALPPLGKFFGPGTGFWCNAEAHESVSHNLDLSLPGIRDHVKIVFDERLVPHIFAQNNSDACYAQGYVTAMHRLWQMDLSTRAAAGEISAILGPRTLNFDLQQRRMGMGFAAENAVKGWSQYPEDMEILNAYTEGVNAFIASLKPSEFPLEYKLMDFEPEPWTPLRSAYFFKSMATRLCLAERDLENTLLSQWLGEERFDFLFPEYNPLDDPIIPGGTVWDFQPVPTRSEVGQQVTLNPDGSRAKPEEYHEGSNNWAVSGTLTASGKPILCNDPHLGLSLPSVWYEIQIVTPEHNVYGVSLPGMPGVVIGFNEHFAWGETNVGHDVLDWYQIVWADSSKTAYLLDGKPTPVDYRIEQIKVRGGRSVIDTVRYTHWGPVAKDGPYEGLAMRWLAHDVPEARESSVFIRINQAHSHEEFVKALADFQTPAQNFVYADQQGNIAMHIGGMLPLRHDRQGRFVQDGSRSSHGWAGRIPASQNPGIINPARGFVSSANQHTTDTSYPYIYHGGFEDFRGRFLNQLLSEMSKTEPGTMKQLQLSNTSLKALEVLPKLVSAISPDDGKPREILQMMAAWDCAYDAESPEAVFFDIWYDNFYELVWDDFYKVRDSMHIYLPEAWRTNLLVLQDADSEEFDIDSTAARETFTNIAQLSFAQAVEQYLSLNEDERQWGEYRNTTIRHLANIPAFNHVLPTSGHGDVLNATTSTHGPSWRMVVHLTEPIEAYVVYPGGQSGNPGSPYYDTMIPSWQKGEYYLVHYLKSPDDIEATDIMNLNPSGQ